MSENQNQEPRTENQEPNSLSSPEFPSFPYHLVTVSSCHRVTDAVGHCVTCSDEAVECVVVQVDATTQMAVVAVQGAQEEIDVSLLDDVAPGDTVLAHAGIGIAKRFTATERTEITE